MKAKQRDSRWRYEISTMVLENEEYKLVPKSAEMLFRPEEVFLSGHVECADNVFNIEAFVGHIIEGEVSHFWFSQSIL